VWLSVHLLIWATPVVGRSTVDLVAIRAVDD
jgi:hypothetical protein